jgi:hypothetical protein
MRDAPLTGFPKAVCLLLGWMAAIGLAGYAINYVVMMPSVGPDAFVPASLDSGPHVSTWFGALQIAFVLLYAFAFLPLTVLFTLRRHRDNPVGVAVAGTLMGLSLLLQLLNSLPSASAMLQPVHPHGVPPEVLLYLRQTDAVRFLAYDVSGFSLAYAAGLAYAVTYLRTRRALPWAMAASVALFVANVPFLWWAPNMAILLMCASILVFAALPVTLAYLASEAPAGASPSRS